MRYVNTTHSAYRRTVNRDRVEYLGPFPIHVLNTIWGIKYALIIDGIVMGEWVSHPGWSYCRDAVLRAVAAKHISTERGNALLLDAHEARTKAPGAMPSLDPKRVAEEA